jgi:hypothetical protein
MEVKSSRAGATGWPTTANSSLLATAPTRAWTVQCSEVTLDGAIGRIRRFPVEDSVRDLIARTPTKLEGAARNSLEYAFSRGRGGLHLTLTPEQYASLKNH